MKKDVQYVLSADVILEKPSAQGEGGISFYFTSSVLNTLKESSYVTQPNKGLKLGEHFTVFKGVTTNYSSGSLMFLFTPTFDLHGTIVGYPYLCNVQISKLSIKTYGDDGFSPDVLVTQIPFPVKVANETFELKAELFDINSSLVYSNLRSIQSFDPSGSTLTSYQPGYAGDPSDLKFISGSLIVSESLEVGQSIIIHSASLVRFLNLTEADIHYSIGMTKLGEWPNNVNQPFIYQDPAFPGFGNDNAGVFYYTPTRRHRIDGAYIIFEVWDEGASNWVTDGSIFNVRKVRTRIVEGPAGWPPDNI